MKNRDDEWMANYMKYRKYHKIFLDLHLMPHIKRCEVCDKKFLRIKRVPKGADDLSGMVDSRHICYECAYWLQFIEKRPEHIQIANGVCYQIFPFIEEPTLSMLLGGDGKKRFFVTKDRQVIKSNDIWVIGTIPERFRDQLPDTGWFCNKSVYGRLFNFNKMCREVGCLDRYKCFRFRTELELENGPFNQLPKKWNVGDEHCRYFIHTDGIENYVSPIAINQN